MKFSKKFESYYFLVNQELELTPVAMLNYFEEVATSHVETVGLGFEYLQELGCGWVLLRWQVEFFHYPVRGERVLVETWPSSFDRFYATREFRMTNEQGQVMAQATALWIFFNLAKRRPVRIPTDYHQFDWVESERFFSEPDKEPQPINRPDFSLEFFIRRSDLDSNGHVNNAKYLEWMLEGVPGEIWTDYRLARMELHYKKEISRSNNGRVAILSEGAQDPYEGGKDQVVFRHQIVAKTEGAIHGLGQTIWLKR